MAGHLEKRSFTLAGHRTSVALEPAFWAALEAEAIRRAMPLSRLIAEADAARDDPALPLASALRVAALRTARSTASEDGEHLDRASRDGRDTPRRAC